MAWASFLNVIFYILQTVVYGMLFAFGLLILKKYGAIVDSNKDNLFSTGISYGLMGAGIIGIGVSDIFLRFYRKG